MLGLDSSDSTEHAQRCARDRLGQRAASRRVDERVDGIADGAQASSAQLLRISAGAVTPTSPSGPRRFEDFRASGIADNILSARLKRLVDEGVLERRRYDERRERFEYLLTEKGRALLPVLAALRRWGQDWTEGRDGSRLTHAACGHEVSARMHCDECGRPVSAEEIRAARAAAPVAPTALGHG